MKASEIIQIIREDYLDDTTEPYLWKLETLMRMLSRAQEEACMRQRFLVDSDTAEVCSVPLVAAQKAYTLDPRIVLVERIEYGGRTLAKRTKDQLDRLQPGWQASTGLIDSYIQKDLKITLVQPPSAADDGQNLSLTVWRMPLAPITELDHVPEIPAQYHFELIWHVIGSAFSLPNEDTQDTRRADFYFAKFDSVFGPSIRADVLAHKRREDGVSFVGPSHAYHGRRVGQLPPAKRFDFE
jgi:hypothetical protein